MREVQYTPQNRLALYSVNKREMRKTMNRNV